MTSVLSVHNGFTTTAANRMTMVNRPPTLLASGAASRLLLFPKALVGLVEVVLMGLAVPVAILMVGLPIAFVIRVIVEILQLL
jgi:hypothetical protein